MPPTAPVAYIVFNRPAHTASSFACIREQRPEELFLIADGPRPDHPTDIERCREVRDIIAEIDWPCLVHREYAAVNLGLKQRVSSGLDWVFSQVGRAIVLEDDCVPNGDFFSFCTELLKRYEDDERVASITGDNHQDGIQRGDGAYYFSKYNHCWGWASWARSWRLFDGDLTFWPEWRHSPHWVATNPDPVERRYWERIFDRVHQGEIDSWAYPWTASTWYHGGLTATPNALLVRNIGFGLDATHTVSKMHDPGRPTERLGPLVHPSKIGQDSEADEYTFDGHFGGSTLRLRRHPLGFIKWGVRGVVRRIKRLSARSISR